MKIYREEIFGPCVAISSFSTEVEAIERANDSFYGLGAALFTRDITRAHTLAKKIESGSKFASVLRWTLTDNICSGLDQQQQRF